MKILLIEDEKKVARFISRGLRENRYVIDIAENGEEGEYLAEEAKYDLIILDLMLPDKDGLSVCRALRNRKDFTPVLMLTARDTLKDKVRGLDAGADDYLVKPFAFAELLARVRALGRRSNQAREKTELKVGNLKLDLLSHTCFKDKREISLTTTEYKVLEYFMHRVGQVVTRTALYEQVWGIDFDTETNLVDVYINHLKNKIGENSIKSVRGSGYVFQDSKK